MSCVKTPSVRFTFVNASDSRNHVHRAYERIFTIARQRLLEQKQQQISTAENKKSC